MVLLLGVWQLVPLISTDLAILSPSSYDLRTRLFPAEPESLKDDNLSPDLSPGSIAGESAANQWSISLDPSATRHQVIKLVAVLALFGLVRNGVASPASFRRFAIVATVNGAFLAGFALLQKFTAPPHVVYWVFETQGSVFGPFVCRNHFPFYVNICLGLGLGLLFGSRVCRDPGRSWSRIASRVGQDPAVLWLIVSLVLMLVATVQSLSRGGVVSILGALLGCSGFAARGKPLAGAVWVVVIVLGLGLAVMSWLGMETIEQRLDTVWFGDALAKGRGPLWERTFPLAKRFPVWGTGYGTFDFIEPSCRRTGDAADISYEHAHNEYLEVLIEGGLCQFLLALTATGLVFLYGIRAYRKYLGRALAGWIFGGLFGFTTVVFHAFGDYGLHVPSIVVLTTVLAAHLVALGTRPASPVRTWRVLPAVVACLVVAVALPLDGGYRERAERFRLAALRAERRLPPGGRDLQIEYLQAATNLRPDDPILRITLADARYREYQTRKENLRVREGAVLTGLWMARLTAPLGLPQSAAVVAHEQWVAEQFQKVDIEYLRPALRDYLLARRENPLLPSSHLRLAGCREYLIHPDTAANYLERCCLLAPADAGLWYLAGRQQLAAGEDALAWASWRKSLECSPAHLSAIATMALSRIGPIALIERILPPQPDLLIAVARLPSLADQTEDRRVFLLRAADLLPDDRNTRPDDLHLRAWALREAGCGPEAVVVYRRAVERAPERVDWRYEWAELLDQQGDRMEARDQLRRVLQQQPDHSRARNLQATLAR
jgi:tetratricopeptide (TPR) repeat protein